MATYLELLVEGEVQGDVSRRTLEFLKTLGDILCLV
jgi:hypothetical protein